MHELVLLPGMQPRLDQIVLECVAFGQHEAAMAALASLRLRLVADPVREGEIKYHLRAGYPVHDVAEAPILPRYAIIDPVQQVWVFGVYRMSSREE